MRSLFAAAFLLAAGPALAGPHCTDEPKSTWLSKAEMVEQIKADDYKISVFKVTSGRCYEIYGRDKNGRRVEVYFHPVTGQAIRVRTR
ncbi:MAG: PepSY domain-containing protein [Hyphomicrobiaceae bacterium]